MRYEIWLVTAFGRRQQLLTDIVSFVAIKTVNSIGQFRLVLPPAQRSLFEIDQIIEIWRGAEGSLPKLFLVGFVRNIQESEATLFVSGPDLNYLLSSRIVAYAAGSAQASKTDNADDMIKAIVRENFGTLATDPDRDISDYLEVLPDTTDGPSLTKGFAWRNILEVLREIASSSRDLGTPLFFQISKGQNSLFEFNTYANLLGIDKTSGSAAVTFGLDFGNLSEPFLSREHQSETNFVYAGGQGDGASRLIVTAEDTTRTSLSPYARREIFADVRNESGSPAVTSEAAAKLLAGRPILNFQGDLIENEALLYGRDWDLGDQVNASFQDTTITGFIDQVQLSVSNTGEERLTGRIDSGTV